MSNKEPYIDGGSLKLDIGLNTYPNIQTLIDQLLGFQLQGWTNIHIDAELKYHDYGDGQYAEVECYVQRDLTSEEREAYRAEQKALEITRKKQLEEAERTKYLELKKKFER